MYNGKYDAHLAELRRLKMRSKQQDGSVGEGTSLVTWILSPAPTESWRERTDPTVILWLPDACVVHV